MLVLGIDPGLAETGWGLVSVQGSSLRYHAHGCIKTKSTMSLEQRLLLLHQELMAILNAHQAAAAAIESLFFAKNISSALPVAHARGALYLSCALMQIPVFEYTPMVIKQAVSGNGRAEKEQVQAMVKVLLGMKELVKPDHAADALAAAICHIHSRGAYV